MWALLDGHCSASTFTYSYGSKFKVTFYRKVCVATCIDFIVLFQHFSCKYIYLCSVALPDLMLCGPMDCSLPGSLPMEFSRQEYWSRLLFPTPGDLPNLGIEPMPLPFTALADIFFTPWSPGKPRSHRPRATKSKHCN